jgi:sporulation protein YlmC with PRC-barrel domain
VGASAGPFGDGEPVHIGARVLAADGECGEVVRVTIDPVTQVLTHLVVAPAHHQALGRLVPVDLIDVVDDDQIRLSCTMEHFRALDDAQDVRFLPGSADVLGYGEHSLTWPYYALETPLSGSERDAMVVDRVPLGEVEVHRGDQVHAADGWVGSVQGLVIDPEDHRVTHVLLQEGHLWGRKQVAIPIGATSRVGEEIRVGLTKQQVEELPSVGLARQP